ncbi:MULTISPECIES: amidohydrolase [unclassified Xanthobacter]|uniref:amidohydrolase n=1 Tax=unclassified Xanthobacter TaxID=2623496 RepID=UPI001EDD731B|nr:MULTISPECIES: amidohydrolase [unclassified Xanthobacter]
MLDMIFKGGPIVTMVEGAMSVEAVGVLDGKIVKVGSVEEVEAFVGPRTEIIDLDGATLLPGFVEAHGHPLFSALIWGEPVVDIRAVHTPTYEAAIAKISRRVAKAAPGEFVMAVGLDPTLHQGMVEPTRDFLDTLAPNNPLAVTLFNFHGIYLNSAAVAACGYENGAPGHLDTEIIRDSNGRPWKFREEMAKRVRNAFYESCGKERAVRELKEWLGKFASAGYTTSAEIGMFPQWSGYFDALRKEYQFPIRMRLYEQVFADTPIIAQVGEGDEFFKAIGTKLWADGSLFVGNVAMTRPYLTTDMTITRMGMPEANRGNLNYSRERLKMLMVKAISAGWQLSVHTQGDETVDTVLDVYEEIFTEYSKVNGPYRLEHCSMMRPDQAERAHKLGLVCSFFNTIAYYWGDALRDDMFGPERADAVLPFGTAVRAGMRVSFHNDAPMTWPNPLLSVQFGVTRTTQKGTVLGEEECLTVEQALRAVTINAAYHLQMEDLVGSIAVGKAADFVVLAGNPLTHPAGKISEIGVLRTYVAGAEKWNAEKVVVTADA